jgi:hypothetical protein
MQKKAISLFGMTPFPFFYYGLGQPAAEDILSNHIKPVGHSFFCVLTSYRNPDPNWKGGKLVRQLGARGGDHERKKNYLVGCADNRQLLITAYYIPPRSNKQT